MIWIVKSVVYPQIGPYILMLMNFFLPNPVDINQIDPADLESLTIMASLIIENHENTSSILFSEFEKYSKSGSKSDELEKFSEFKVTGILSCFFKAIGKDSLSCHIICLSP